MKKQTILLSILLIISSFFAGNISAQIEATNSPAISDAQDVLRSNLLLQEQLHTALRAIEQARQDADTTANKNAELFTGQLNAVKKDLAVQRERDLETIVSLRQSNRVALIAAASLAGIGLFALFLTAYFQIRAMNRMTEISALYSSSISLDSPRALDNGGSNIPARLNSSEQTNARFLAAVEQLEKRILELDSDNSFPRAKTRMELAQNGNDSLRETDSESLTQIDSLLGKGQSFLNSNETEQALRCFEDALKLDANNTDALIKKGSALEGLRKLPEAIEAYNCAIAIDSSLTVAYLYKGGVLNRLQRFNEAMECYEQALSTHPKEAA